jgi:hypothetical protein
LQIDVKFLEIIAGSRKRLYQFTAIDDCTRIRVLKIYDVCNQKSAIRFVDEVVRRLPFRVLAIQTDNAEFQSNFHWRLEEHDIRHVYIQPKTPRLNGKVERSHRVDEQEFYQLLDKDCIADDIHLFNDKLQEWEGLQLPPAPRSPRRTDPYERLLARKASASVSPMSSDLTGKFWRARTDSNRRPRGSKVTPSYWILLDSEPCESGWCRLIRRRVVAIR